MERASDLKYGRGSALWKYWTRGEGFAKWSGAVHKWTTLRDLLLKAGVPAISADGLTTNIIQAVMPGYMKQAHAKTEHKAGRSAVTTMTERADTKNRPYGNVTYADPKNGKYPIDTEAHCRAAWSYINMPKNAAMYPMNGVTLSEVKDRIKAALKKYGADVSSDSSASRAEPVYFRTYELEDIHIVRSAQGDATGRLVEAYATAFNSPAEIQDFEGHYIEEIDPAAFNKVLADIGRSRAGFGKVKVMYNHGMTIHGTPSERGSMPIATPVDIRPEARGLLTLARYSDTPFADEVLENIRNGSITAQSFTGRIVRSDPQLRRGAKHYPRNGELPRVRRMELGLKEFGPTPFEAYSGAEIVGVRMSTPGTWEPDESEHDEALPPDEEAAAGEPLTRADDGGEVEHSARYHQHALYRMNSEEKRKAAGLVW
jgi:HK97 family phage prohead protease